MLRRSALVIVLTSLAGLVLGLLAATRVDTGRSATTPILINPLDGNPYYPGTRGENLLNLGSEAEALRSDAVAELVATATRSDSTPAELLSRVKVGVPVNTQILEVTYSSKRPGDALRYSQAFADAYLRFRQSRADERTRNQTRQLDDQITDINAQLEDLTAQLANTPSNSASAALINQRMGALASQLNTLNARKSELITGSRDPGQVVTPAKLDPTGPLDLRIVLPILGLLAGATVGVAIALLRSRTDPRLHHPDAVQAAGVAVLGTVGWADPGALGLERDPALVAEDEYRRLRVAVLAQEKRRPLALLVGGTSEDAHGPVTAVDLAISFARSGLDTVVIDATAGKMGPSRVLAPFTPTGLSDVLLGNAGVTDTLVPVAPLLWVLPPGNDLGEAADLLMSEAMRRMLMTAKERSDVVIVAADSVQTGSSQSLASMVDAVVIETEQGHTTTEELLRAAHALERLGPSFLGTVFIGRHAVRRTTAFTADTGLSQRQLQAGPKAMLGPGAVALPSSSEADPEPPSDRTR